MEEEVPAVCLLGPAAKEEVTIPAAPWRRGTSGSTYP